MKKSDIEGIVTDRGIGLGDIILLEYYDVHGRHEETHLGMFKGVYEEKGDGRLAIHSGIELRPPVECNEGCIPNIVSYGLDRGFPINDRNRIYSGLEEINLRLFERPELEYYAKLFETSDDS